MTPFRMHPVHGTRRFLSRLGICVSAVVVSSILAGGTAWAPPHGPPTPPKPPTGVTATPGNRNATVAWSEAAFSVYGYYPTGYVATAYVHRSAVATCTTSGLHCTLTGLRNRLTYKVKVRTTFLGRDFVPKESQPSIKVLVTPAS